ILSKEKPNLSTRGYTIASMATAFVGGRSLLMRAPPLRASHRHLCRTASARSSHHLYKRALP
ncbi:hypothetical protein B296_00033557, partial [Ensete ventricosum]